MLFECQIIQMPPKTVNSTKAWKLFRLRKDGTLGPLFINKKLIVEEGIWFPAEDHPTKGYKCRPGWHCTPRKFAPHLTTKGRVWVEVEIADYQDLQKPESQGGTWYLAKWLKVTPRI
jgi:hypothetical protein